MAEGQVLEKVLQVAGTEREGRMMARDGSAWAVQQREENEPRADRMERTAGEAMGRAGRAQSCILQ